MRGHRAWDQPDRFYGISGGSCAIGLNLYDASGMEFHGASFWGGNTTQTHTVSVTGTLSYPSAYILFDGLQLGPSPNDNMYLDQQNETVICAGNCLFADANTNKANSSSAIVIGHDATATAIGVSPIVLQLDRAIFHQPDLDGVGFDIAFQPLSGIVCNCVVALGAGAVDIATKQGSAQPGAPTTNYPTKLTGQTVYAAPTFANAATVGVPLTLNPNELGMGLSTDTEGPPGLGGLKLRVECSTIGSHNVRSSRWLDYREMRP